MKVLIFKDETHWIAQCIDRDICAASSKFEDLLPRLRLTIEAEDAEPTEIPPPPRVFIDAFEAAEVRFTNEITAL